MYTAGDGGHDGAAPAAAERAAHRQRCQPPRAQQGRQCVFFWGGGVRNFVE